MEHLTSAGALNQNKIMLLQTEKELLEIHIIQGLIPGRDTKG